MTGSTIVPGLMSASEVAAVLDSCAHLRMAPDSKRARGDKPNAGTHHLNEIDKRVPLIAELLRRPALVQAVTNLIGHDGQLDQASYRSPQPGYGSQKLHTDDLPKFDDGPDRVATAIVALVDFTSKNGATRFVPDSHLRPDLQRLGGNLNSHEDEQLALMTSGSAFVFSGHLLHSGTKNVSTAERPALQLVWRV